ncbi:uncharacterized protein BN803_01954 [Firmicutes bacterium CAG:882]|jgi:hypothetical protein|nr:uncharacterized protein BN803_01954 [Firmicutes bacterium CAG:882]
MLEINKQNMKCSRQGQRVTIYETDDDGNIIYEGYTDSEGNFTPYLDSKGNKIPRIKEEYIGYSLPVAFKANIAFSGGEAQAEEYGFNVADFDAVMLTERNELPLSKGDVIWLDSEIGYKDEDKVHVDEITADFIVVGVKPSLTSTKYMLKAQVK